jgi:hypothetical protein
VRDWVTPANELQGPEIGSAVFGQMFSGVNELRNVVNINALTVGREVIASGIPAGTTITGINVGTRTATLSNPVGTDFTAGVGQVTVVNGGLGYTVAPTVTFNPANGATAVANISGGRVTSVLPSLNLPVATAAEQQPMPCSPKREPPVFYPLP